jgi:hypothetical protein
MLASLTEYLQSSKVVDTAMPTAREPLYPFFRSKLGAV